LARMRKSRAASALRCCRLCAHDCGVDRTAGEKGPCRAGTEARYFSAQTEVADELELIPTFALALSGCDLRCDFCLTGSSSWNPRAGLPFDAPALAARARESLRDGARSVMILGGEPSIHLPALLEFIGLLPDDAQIIWKTNAHGSQEGRELLEGLMDVYLADYKFGNDACARRLARVQDYNRIVRENLKWARRHADVMVRHLLMPGHLECCWAPVANWLAEQMPGIKVSLRSGYWPAWRASRHPELGRTVGTEEMEKAVRLALELGLNLVP